MGRALGGLLPGGFGGLERRSVGKAFGGDQSFQRGEPVLVIVALLGSVDLSGQGLGPFGPSESVLRLQVNDHREGLGVPGLLEGARVERVGGLARHSAASR